jgi:hypothetical protein
MLWTFHRRNQQFHYEIHHAENDPGFELVLYHPDGQQTRERFSDPAALNQRVMHLQQSLLEDGWDITSSPGR